MARCSCLKRKILRGRGNGPSAKGMSGKAQMESYEVAITLQETRYR